MSLAVALAMKTVTIITEVWLQVGTEITVDRLTKNGEVAQLNHSFKISKGDLNVPFN